MKSPTITVLGAGYVGLTTAAVFAHSGYKVFLIEPNAERLDVIKTGKSFFFEHGLDPIIAAAVSAGNLVPTDSYEEAIPASSVIFSCVGTPDNPDGSSNLSYVFAAAETTAKLAQSDAIYVQKSTVPVGTGAKIEQLFASLKTSLPYVSNPEFLREGTALYDTLFFDRVVAGGNDQAAVAAIIDLYKDVEKSRDAIAALADVPSKPRAGHYITTSLNSAELIKVTSNAFLALKISFANSIARLADKADADVIEVMDAVGADERIGRAFLNAGRGYGGGCFPKDVSGLIASGLEYGVDLDIMQAAQSVNDAMPGYAVDKLQDALGGSLQGKKVAVLGLAFKAGTSDVRRSPGVAIVDKLQRAGATVVAYDPEADYEDIKEPVVDIVDSIESATKDANAVVLATEWEEILNYPAEKLAENMSGTILLDAINRYDASSASRAGLRYLGVGHAA